MSKITEYRQTLKNLDDWIPFLLKESGLPGPRGNLELAQAVAHEGDGRQFEKLLSFSAEARENTPQVFLVFCGVVGLGKLAAQGKREIFARLRAYASDPRWRVREAVATGLQLVGDENMSVLLKEMQRWSKGNWYEKRAVAAALSEPRLLKDPHNAGQVLQILDRITASMQTAGDPKDEAFKVLRQAMGYCWSVATTSLPKEGRPMMEKWLTSENKDIFWVMKENLKKNRLVKMDPQWVKVCQSKLALYQIGSDLNTEKTMSSQTEFPFVFEELKSILKPYSSKLKVKADAPDTFYLEGAPSAKWKKELFFASAQIKKNYVSFYLMPVYMYPDLLKGISPELKKHMQGKSCFNFKKVETPLFAELARLTKRGFDRFMREGYP